MKSRTNPFLRSAFLAVSIVLTLGHAAYGAIITWDSNTGTTGAQDGGGTWTTGAGGWWNGTANVNWTAGDQAIFGAGTDGTYAIILGGAISVGNGDSTTGGLNFANSGYTLSAATRTVITLGASGTSTGVIKVASGKTATIGNNVTVQKGAAAQIALLGGGTLEVATGGILTNTNSNTNEVANGSTLRINGGSVTFQTSLVVGQFTSGWGNSGTLIVDAGSLTINTNNLNVGRANGDVSVATLNGGTITVTAGNLNFGATATSTSTFNLNGGTLSVKQITDSNTTSLFNFNGGTLKASASAVGATYMTGLDRANIRNGGATIDTNAQSLTIGQALLHSNIGGDNATDGGLTLNDSAVTKGTLTLTGSNTYTGNTTIQSGTLKLGTGGSISSSALIDVQAGTTFDVTTAGFTLGGGKTLKGGGSVSGSVTVADTGIVTGGNGTIGTLTIGSLTFNNTGTLNVGSLTNYATAPALNVTGALTLSGAAGAVTINLPTAAAGSGTYKLLGFGSGISDTTGFTLGTAPALGSRQSGSGLQYDGTNKLLTYTITAVNPMWTGAQSSEWSTNTIGGSSNWKLPSNAPTDFLVGDEVLFNDSATNKTVAISGGSDVAPASVTFTNTTGNDYILQGPKGITGSAVLTKSGTGTLTISNANSYTGATSITNGTLVLNGSLASTAVSVGSGATLSQGAAGVIGGTASLTTSGTVTLAGTNTYSGATAINAGSLTISGTGTLGSGSAIGLGGGSLNLGGTSQTVGTVSVTAAASSGDTISNGSLTGTSYSASNSSGNAIVSASLLANGTAGFSMSGGGTATLSGTNNYTGTTAVSGGTLKAGSSTAFANLNALSMSGSGTLDLGGFNAGFTNILASAGTNTITTTGSGSGTDTLTISNLTAATGALFSDNGTRKLAVSLNGTLTLDPLTNASNTFSGGLTMESMRLSAVNNSAVTGGRYGKGTITIGNASQVYFNAANVTISNDFIVNSAAGNGSRTGSFRIASTGETLSGTITASGSAATFSADAAGSLLLTGKLTGSNGFTFNQSSGTAAWTATLNNASSNNDYAGPTTIGNSQTTVKLGAANQIPNGTNTGNVSLTGILDLNGFDETINGLSGAGTVDNVTTGTANTLTFGDNNATGGVFSGLIKNTTGSLSLVKTGTGSQTLSGANTFTGGLSVKNGTLIAGGVSTALGGSSAGVANGLGSVTLGDTTGTNTVSLLASTTGLNFANPIILASNGSISLGNTGTAISTTFSGGVTGNNDLTIISNATTGTVSLTTGAINNAGKITNTGAGSGTTTISSSIGSNVTEVIENSASSSLLLNGSNSAYAGNYSVKNGRIAIGTGFAVNASSKFNLGATSAGTNNTTLSFVNNFTIANDINVRAGNSGTKTISLGTSADITSTLSGKVTLDDNLILDASGATAAASLTLSGNIVDGASGAKGLVKNGPGVAILSGAGSDFSGGVTISSGELRIANAAALGNSTNITVGGTNNSGMTLTGGITAGSGKTIKIKGGGIGGFFGALATATTNSGTSEWQGSVTIDAATGTRIGSQAGTLKISGNIGETTAGSQLVIRNSGTGITILSGNNSYTGDTIINASGGELQISGGSAIYDSGLVNVTNNAGNIFRVSGSETIGGLTGGGNTNAKVAIESGQILTLSSGTQTFLGAIEGAGALTVNGANQTLGGSNTYTGATNVSTGILTITGNQSAATGAVTVASAATLKGTGTIGGATTIQTGGLMNAGAHSDNSPTATAPVGKQTFSSNLTLNSQSIFSWDLSGEKDTSNGTRGTDYDAVDVGGNLSAFTTGATPAPASDAIFRVIVSSGFDFTTAFWADTHTWSDIFTVTGSITGWATGTAVDVNTYNFATNTYSTANPTAQGAFTISGSTLTWSAVPEPSSALVGLLVGAGLLRRRRQY